jgi:hypothetical protein
LQAWKKPAGSVEEEQQPQEDDDDADNEEESQHKMSGKTSSLVSLLELTDLWTQIASQRLQKNKTKTNKTKPAELALPVDSLKSRNSPGITSLLTLPAYNKTQQKSKRVSDSHQFPLNFNSNACATRMTILITHSLTHAAQHQQNSNN